MSKNDITGDKIISRGFSSTGRNNYDDIFAKKSIEDWVECFKLSKSHAQNVATEHNVSFKDLVSERYFTQIFCLKGNESIQVGEHVATGFLYG